MIAAVLVAVIMGLLVFRIFRNDKINLPGPIPWPIFGNIWQISPDRPHETIDKWHKKFNRVFKMYELGTPVVLVGSYEGMHEVLLENGKDCSGRPTTYRFMLSGEFHSWQDVISLSQPDPTWKMLRLAAQKNLKKYDTGMKRIEDMGTEICQDMLNQFASHDGEAFELGESVMNAFVNNLTMFLLGKKFSKGDKLFRQFFDVERLSMVLRSSVGPHALIDTFPWLRFFGNKTDRLFRGLVQKRHDLFMQMKKEVLENSSGLSDKGGTLLGSFLGLQSDPQFVGGEARVKCACNNMIFAGAGPSTSTFLAFVNIVTHYRNVYTKLQSEIDEVLGTRNPRLEDRDSMPYMRATIFETLRYTSISPFSIPHMAIKDTTIGGAFIPKGTQILVNLWSALHDESYWPEPFEFLPERFLDETGNLLPPDHINLKRLMPFGAGPRVCLGEKFALGRLFLLMTSTIQRFKIKQPEPKVSCDPRNYKMALILDPPDFKVSMTPRQPAI